MPRDRLLIVVDGMEVGGSQRQIQHLLAGLDRERWEPELAFFRSESFLVDVIGRTGVPVHYVRKRHRIDPRFILAFARLLHRGDYALVHAFSLTAELWSMACLRLSGRRSLLIASERSFDGHKPAWHWPLKRIVISQSAAVIANSRAGANSTARLARAQAGKMETIPNCVELPAPMPPDTRAAIREALGAPRGRAVGLFVGRLVEQKNLPCLVRALAALEPGDRPWIAIAGDGPLHEPIAQLADSVGVSGSIRLLGERKDAQQLMQAADFLVLPSHFEGQSNALLEAMAAGCPVVASAVGGTPELVGDGRTGLLVPPDDAGALAVAMQRLADDPGLRSSLARAACTFVTRHHSPASLAAATSAVYERCLSGRVAPGTVPISSAYARVAQPRD